MGTSLSLRPPGRYACPVCNKTFSSVQAVGGHQNAHRRPMNIQIHLVNILQQEEENWRRSSSRVNIPAEGIMMNRNANASGAAVDDHEIDLELRLGSGPPKKVMKFYDFLVEGNGVGGASSSAGSGGGGGGAINCMSTCGCVMTQNLNPPAAGGGVARLGTLNVASIQRLNSES